MEGRRLALTVSASIILALSCSSSPSTARNAVTVDEHAPIATCPQDALSVPIEQLIRPVLEAAIAKQDEWDSHFESAFYALLESRDHRALEAQVALMAYYLGEHYGEELVETVLKHGPVADDLILQYKQCRPPLSFDDELSGILVSQTMYVIYEQLRDEIDDDG